jgi:hypothetical protein
VTHLGEAGGGEAAAAANVELLHEEVLPLRDHRVALEGTRAAFTGEVDGGARERTADPAAPVPRTGGEAGHGPDAVVGLVFGSARPGDAAEAYVGGARLDRAPADGLAVEVGDEAARRVCLGLTAAGLSRSRWARLATGTASESQSLPWIFKHWHQQPW